MSGLSAKFEAMSLSQRIEFVTSRTCSPEARNVIMQLETLASSLRTKLAIQEGGIQGDALGALNEAPGLKARAETAESRVTRLKALVAATAALDSDLETIIRLGDRVLEQTERAEAAEARVKAFESAACIVTEPDGTIPVREQADACVDALSVLMETSGREQQSR